MESSSFPVSSSSQKAMMEEISEEEGTFDMTAGEIQTASSFHGNTAGWTSGWDWMGVSRMCTLLYTLCDLDTGVPQACQRVLTMQRC